MADPSPYAAAWRDLAHRRRLVWRWLVAFFIAVFVLFALAPPVARLLMANHAPPIDFKILNWAVFGIGVVAMVFTAGAIAEYRAFICPRCQNWFFFLRSFSRGFTAPIPLARNCKNCGLEIGTTERKSDL